MCVCVTILYVQDNITIFLSLIRRYYDTNELGDIAGTAIIATLAAPMRHLLTEVMTLTSRLYLGVLSRKG